MEHKTNNIWKAAFFISMGSFTVISILLSFLLFSYVSYDYKHFMANNLETYEDAYINLELFIDFLQEKNTRITREELFELYKLNDGSGNFRGKESNTETLYSIDGKYAFSIGHLRFEFDRDGYLEGLRAEPNYRNLRYRKEYQNSIVGNFLFAIHRLRENLWSAGTDKHMIFGLIIILIMFTGIVYYVTFELSSKKITYITIASSMFIFVNFLGFISLFWKIYDYKINFEEALKHEITVDAELLIGGLDWSLLYPTFLFSVIMVNSIFLFISLMRMSKYKYN